MANFYYFVVRERESGKIAGMSSIDLRKRLAPDILTATGSERSRLEREFSQSKYNIEERFASRFPLDSLEGRYEREHPDCSTSVGRLLREEQIPGKAKR